MVDYDYAIDETQTLIPLPNVILVHNMEYGEFITANGIIIPDDNGKETGIRPRWGTVYSIGNKVEDIKVGDAILVSHGRWTRGIRIRKTDGSFTVIRRVDPTDILLVREVEI